MTETELLLRQAEQKLAELETDSISNRLLDNERYFNRGEDYRKIMNLMAEHAEYQYQGRHAEELRTLWSTQRDDIVMAHGDLAHIGRAAVEMHYVTCFERLSEKPVVLTMLSSPFIEIAEDGMSAQAVFMTNVCRRIEGQEPESSFTGSLMRYAADLLKEDGEWKIWHLRDYPDLAFHMSPAEDRVENAADAAEKPLNPEEEAVNNAE